jgi:hypothetical protein
MSALFSGKLQGQTAGSVAIATVSVELSSDDLMRYTDANGDVHYVTSRSNRKRTLALPREDNPA